MTTVSSDLTLAQTKKLIFPYGGGTVAMESGIASMNVNDYQTSGTQPIMTFSRVRSISYGVFRVDSGYLEFRCPTLADNEFYSYYWVAQATGRTTSYQLRVPVGIEQRVMGIGWDTDLDAHTATMTLGQDTRVLGNLAVYQGKGLTLNNQTIFNWSDISTYASPPYYSQAQVDQMLLDLRASIMAEVAAAYALKEPASPPA
jgi:hypothetical protein